MPADPSAIRFRPVAATDLRLLARWMEAPHWREWWGDPATELGYVRDMVEGRDSTRPFLFDAGGPPLGYIQVWRIAEARVEPWLTEAPWLTLLPDDAVGVDLSIGEPALVGRGLGSAALRAFVAMLRAEGDDVIVIDPDPANARAIRAYAKAGFRPIPELLGRTGDSLLMRHHRDDDGGPGAGPVARGATNTHKGNVRLASAPLPTTSIRSSQTSTVA